MGGRIQGNYRNPCLTLHQPWASLLVYGIKRIEGRSWPAPIRVYLCHSVISWNLNVLLFQYFEQEQRLGVLSLLGFVGSCKLQVARSYHSMRNLKM
ncbi:hypothetical protein HHK36_026887 [Tetracentron sinense]|uniref:ASCH domain-containing protein n=1 Tax=Tetracentron sinense TaxID=13715 RepID=A0A834YM67_TETSI|nr:hypothetical protein HHK36_026887 [Tetracentron sinense]